MTDGTRSRAPGPVVGVVLLAHTAFDRAEQVIRFWSRGGCPVVVHVDAAVDRGRRDAFASALSDLPDLAFSPRHRCEWGTWGIVAATLDASRLMLDRFPAVSHVFLASGACLPLRPVAALRDHLAARPGVDFIESASTADVPWTVGGLSGERFTLRFPFPWRRRRLFDAAVRLQRRWAPPRRLPAGVVPHMGSQWWCLTRPTLRAILDDPRRPELDRWFRWAWVPDESYFQTLARRHAPRVESRSLTLSKFDQGGKPHVFYDDHLQLLRRSDCFVARKAWPGAGRLYDAFLAGEGGAGGEPAPGRIGRAFAQAAERRLRGRPGLWMQSRFPHEHLAGPVTAAPFGVFEGFAELWEDWEAWLARATGARVHGHLFAPEGAEFAGRTDTFAGNLPASAALRDHNAQMFLRNLVWTTRGERQAFQFGPRDSQALSWDIAKDPNATVAVVTGAWAVPLFRSGAPLDELRGEAARLQRIEADHLEALRSRWARARVRIWTMAEFLDAPEEALRQALEGGWRARRSSDAPPEMPRLVDLRGFGRFLQDLRDRGMHPYLLGDVPAEAAPPPEAERAADRPRRRYLAG